MDSPGSELCQSCGLCCDGTLYGWVAVEADEAPRFHLKVVEEIARFDQPCEHLAGTRCTVYETRPRACVNYRGVLLTKLDEATVTVEHARSTVARARMLRDELLRALPPGPGDLWARISREDRERQAAVATGAELPEWVLVAAALRGLLGREFAERFRPGGGQDASPPTEKKS